MIPFKIISFKEYLKRTIRFCVFCIILYPTMSLNSSQNIISSQEKDQGWEIVKIDKNEVPSWIIYTRKIIGISFLEYKIEGNIESSPKACISSFKEEIHNQANDTSNKKYPTYEIRDESIDSLLTYVIHNEPFPFKSTEMSVRYVFFSDENGMTGVRWREAWEDSPNSSSKKLKRIETFRGGWNFDLISNNQTKAVNNVQFDPKKMPRWLFEPMVFNFLKKGLEDLRNKTIN